MHRQRNKKVYSLFLMKITTWCAFNVLFHGILFLFQDLGVTKVGHIKRLLQAIKDITSHSIGRKLASLWFISPSVVKTCYIYRHLHIYLLHSKTLSLSSKWITSARPVLCSLLLIIAISLLSWHSVLWEFTVNFYIIYFFGHFYIKQISFTSWNYHVVTTFL